MLIWGPKALYTWFSVRPDKNVYYECPKCRKKGLEPSNVTDNAYCHFCNETIKDYNKNLDEYLDDEKEEYSLEGKEVCPKCGKRSFEIMDDGSAFCYECGHSYMDYED